MSKDGINPLLIQQEKMSKYRLSDRLQESKDDMYVCRTFCEPHLRQNASFPSLSFQTTFSLSVFSHL